MRFLWEIRHLWILMLLIGGVGVGAVMVRNRLVPETYGDKWGRYGPYRVAALEQLAAHPSRLVPQATCEQCHTDVQEERDGTLHEDVACTSCHGLGRNHVTQALQAEENPDIEIDPPGEWDGDLMTKMDLFKAPHRSMCLSCHESVVGMPSRFAQIIVAEHLEEQEASEPEAVDVCFECHGYHDTEP